MKTTTRPPTLKMDELRTPSALLSEAIRRSCFCFSGTRHHQDPRLRPGQLRKEHTMKFYYKGQLIRTSKTHAYNWAILTERPDGTYACHGCRVNRSDADSEASRLSRRGVDHIIIAPLEQRGR